MAAQIEFLGHRGKLGSGLALIVAQAGGQQRGIITSLRWRFQLLPPVQGIINNCIIGMLF
jgi:hypothetical protein